MATSDAPAALVSLLEEVAADCHPHRRELFQALAHALRTRAPEPLRLLAAIADAGPHTLHPREELADGRWPDPSAEGRAAMTRTRAIAKRFMALGASGDDLSARLARAIGASFAWELARGLPHAALRGRAADDRRG